jgi:hypothetical protein
MGSRRFFVFLLIALTVFSMTVLAKLRALDSSRGRSLASPTHRVFGTSPPDDAGAAAAFGSMLRVLRHPRCMNCHSKGDFPRQGDDKHRHTLNVRRGLDGDGTATVKCNTCHQPYNLAGPHMPPGAPDWHMPSPEMPMIWEGLSDTQLCESFKDPAQNGGRTVDQIVEHMGTPLVLWGWHPGEGRTQIPVPQSEFLTRVKEWASKGAACPSETSTKPSK